MITPQEAIDRLQKICSRQEKCPADVILLMNRWGVKPEHHQAIISTLKTGRFLDEQRFASAFVRDKIRFDRWGLVKIRYYLKRKLIAAKIVDEACRSVDRNEYAGMIRKELEKKKKTMKGTPREIWAKLARHGTSRGYEMEYMQDFLDEFEAAED